MIEDDSRRRLHTGSDGVAVQASERDELEDKPNPA